jgi:hypothetical protein
VRLITDFNQIEIEKALTAKMRRIIWLLYARLESVVYCQVRCYSAAHLSDNCLDGRITNADLTKPGEQVDGDCVDIEHIVKEHPYYTARRTTKG